MLMEITKNGSPWGLMVSTDYSYILNVASNIILQSSNIIQVWETKDDPDTFLTANIIFSRNTNTGKSFTLYRCSDGKYEIKDNNSKEYITGKTAAGFSWGRDYTYSKHFYINTAESIVEELTK